MCHAPQMYLTTDLYFQEKLLKSTFLTKPLDQRHNNFFKRISLTEPNADSESMS